MGGGGTNTSLSLSSSDVKSPSSGVSSGGDAGRVGAGAAKAAGGRARNVVCAAVSEVAGGMAMDMVGGERLKTESDGKELAD